MEAYILYRHINSSIDWMRINSEVKLGKIRIERDTCEIQDVQTGKVILSEKLDDLSLTKLYQRAKGVTLATFWESVRLFSKQTDLIILFLDDTEIEKDGQDQPIGYQKSNFFRQDILKMWKATARHEQLLLDFWKPHKVQLKKFSYIPNRTIIIVVGVLFILWMFFIIKGLW